MHIKTFFHRISLPTKGGYSSKKVQNLDFVELSTVIRFLYEGTTEFLTDPRFPQLVPRQPCRVMISESKSRDTHASRAIFAAHFPSILLLFPDPTSPLFRCLQRPDRKVHSVSAAFTSLPAIHRTTSSWWGGKWLPSCQYAIPLGPVKFQN